MNAWTLVVVEDHGAVSEGVTRLLEDEGFRVAGTAATLARGLELVAAQRPSVAIVDIALPDGSGIDLVRQAKQTAPDTAVLLYTGLTDPGVFLDVLDCGAEGFVLKGGALAELVEAVRTLARGGMYLDPRLGRMLGSAQAERRAPSLRPREREVLGLIASGLTGPEVAERLVLSPDTVRSHVRHAMERLGARTRAHAVALALAAGEIDAGLED